MKKQCLTLHKTQTNLKPKWAEGTHEMFPQFKSQSKSNGFSKYDGCVMHGKEREELRMIVSRQSNKALLSRAGATRSKDIGAGCASPIDKSEREQIKDDPAEAKSMFEEIGGEASKTNGNKGGVCREKDNKLMKQKMEERKIQKHVSMLRLFLN